MREKLTWLDLWNLLPLTSPLHDLIISAHVKKFFPHAKHFYKNSSPIICRGERKQYALSSYLFPFLKVSSKTFVAQTTTFQAKLPSDCF